MAVSVAVTVAVALPIKWLPLIHLPSSGWFSIFGFRLQTTRKSGEMGRDTHRKKYLN